MRMRWRDLLTPFRHSLKGQLVLFFLLLDLSTLGVTSLVVVTDATGVIEGQIRQRLDANADHVSWAITEDLRTKREQLRTLAGNTLLVNGVIDTLGRDAYLTPFIERLTLAGRAPEHTYIALLDYRGRLISENHAASRDFRDAAWLPAILNGEAHSAAFIDERRGPTFRFAFPVHYLGSVEGVILAEFPLTFLDGLTPSTEQVRVSLVDDAGQVVYGSVPHAVADIARAHAGSPRLDEHGGRLYNIRNLAELGEQVQLHWHLVLSMDGSVITEPVRELMWRMLAVGLFSVLAVIALVIFRARRFVQPLTRLQSTMHAIMEGGDMSRSVRVDSDDEIGALGSSFNRMMEKLSAQDAVLREEVRERRRAEAELLQANDALCVVLRELKEAQAQLVQSEKLASIGQLAAGVAHEINNPVGFVTSNLHTLRRYGDDLLGLCEAYGRLLDDSPDAAVRERLAALRSAVDFDFLSRDLGSLLDESQQGLTRIARIVADLKDFSHVDQPEAEPIDFNAMLDRVINIAWNELKYKAEVVREYGPLPPVRCRAGHIGQVFLNLLVNAAQAIPEKGEVRIRTEARGSAVVVTLSDTGCGIPPELIGKVFDPFFTTKPVGKGTGLGLHIVYKLVQDHGGRIEVASEVGRGTVFTVHLPVDGPPRKAAGTAAAEAEAAA